MSANLEVNYRNAALIVWDMQNAIANRASNFTEIVKNTRTLIDAAHENHIPVIFSQHTGLPYEYLSKYSRYSLQRRGIDPKNSTFVTEGSDEWRIVDELKPSPDDLVIKKYTPSFFTGTMIEQIFEKQRHRNDHPLWC